MEERASFSSLCVKKSSSDALAGIQTNFQDHIQFPVKLSSDLDNLLSRDEMTFALGETDTINLFDKKVSMQMINSSVCPKYDKGVNYYQEFWKIFIHNEILITQLKKQVQEIRLIQETVDDHEKFFEEIETEQANTKEKKQMKKKNRRTASEIQKDFQCPYQNCQKLYGSEVSLNLHIKLKHNGGNKTEREKIAKNLIQGKLKEENLSEMGLNFPPGYLATLKESLNKNGSDKPKKTSNSREKSSLDESDDFNSNNDEGLRSNSSKSVKKKIKFEFNTSNISDI